MPNQQATTPVPYTDPVTGVTQMGLPKYDINGNIIGFTPVPIPDTSKQDAAIIDSLKQIPQNTAKFYGDVGGTLVNVALTGGKKSTPTDTTKPVTYTGSQTGLVIQGTPVLNAAGKVIGFTPVGVTPTASQTQAMTADANAVQNDFTTTTANDVSRSDLRATLDGANTASSVAMAASPKDPRYHPLSNYQPKVETQPDGTKIVTIEGSYLNDMMKNFYKAGAASAKVEVSPVTNAVGQSITGQNTVATAGLVTAPDNSRTSSPTGAQQIYADNYTPVTTQHILDQLKSNPANSKMSTADILAALTRK